MKHWRIILALGLLALLGSAGPAGAAEKWTGVDDAVVAKVARQANRPPRKPFINTDQGDLLLFVFLGAGGIGGFVAGYYYRELFSSKRRTKKEADV